MKYRFILLLCTLAVWMEGSFAGTVPEQMNYQAKIEEGGVPFDGVGQFKFAIVDQVGTTTYWSNDGTSSGGGEPANAVSLNVSSGLLNVMLGNEAHPYMNVLPASTFENPDTWLRVWFGGASGASFEQLTPDTKFGSVPYAMMAANVPDNSITKSKLAHRPLRNEAIGRDIEYFSFHDSRRDYSGHVAGNVTTVPTNKVLIITDVVYGLNHSTESPASIHLEYELEGLTTILLRQMISGSADQSPDELHFESGLAIPPTATLKAWSFNDNYTGIFLSGYYTDLPAECDTRITSYFAEFSLVEDYQVYMGQVPTNSNYVITDIVFGSPDNNDGMFYLKQNANPDGSKSGGIVYRFGRKGTLNRAHHSALKSGIAFEGGQGIGIESYGRWGSGTYSVTISGFEVPTQ